MRYLPTIIGGLGLLIGLVWILQGLNILPGSFMSGQMKWFYIGVVVAVVSAGLLLWSRRR